MPEARERLRVVLVANWFAPFTGGAQIVVRSLAQELARRHTVTVLTPHRDPRSPGEERDGLVLVRRCTIPGSRGSVDVGRKPWAPGILAELLRTRFDVVVAFPSLGPGASMASLARRLQALRGRSLRCFLFVFDLIDYSREDLTTFPDPRRVRAAVQPRGALRRGVRQARLRAFDGVFALGGTEARVLGEVVPFCALLPVCVDLQEFPRPARPPFTGRAATFGCIGRITPHKGQDLALRAFALAQEQLGPESRLVIAGAVYDPAFHAGLIEARRELALDAHVEILTDLPRRELLRVYSECDAHLIPARFLSGGSIVQEAWAAGRPVVQSDRVDPSLAREAEDGLTFRFPSVTELASRMVALASDPLSARRMGNAGRERVERVFHYGRLAAALELAWARARARTLRAEDARDVEALAWDGEAPQAAAPETAELAAARS